MAYSQINFTIKDPTLGTSTTIQVASNSTIEALKKLYAQKIGGGKAWNGYKFVFGTGTLSDADRVPSIPGQGTGLPGIILKASYQDPPIAVNVRGLDGKTKKITAYGSWTVRRLKEEYARWLGQGWDNVVMLYRAKRLKDEDFLSTYNIEPEGFIQANIRSVGGDGEE